VLETAPIETPAETAVLATLPAEVPLATVTLATNLPDTGTMPSNSGSNGADGTLLALLIATAAAAAWLLMRAPSPVRPPIRRR
jgi:hypothetical protein